MKISHRLIGSAAFSSAGLLVIAAVSYFAVTSIQLDLVGLTSRASPLQSKAHEAQERTERLMGSLLRLTLVANPADARRLAQSVRDETAALRRLQEEIRRIDPASVTDVEDFERAAQSISLAVDKRLGDEAKYRAETEAAAAALQQAEQAAAAARQGVNELEKDAMRASDAAQEQSRRLAEAMKQILSADSRLKHIAVLISEVGAVSQTTRVPTLRAEARAAAAAVQQIDGEGEGAAALRGVKSSVAEIQDQIVREGTGLIALREAVLRGGPDAEAAYARQRSRTVDTLDQQSQRLSAAIDDLELKAVKQRQTLDESLKVRNEPGGVIVVSQSVSLGIREAVAALRLLMLTENADDAKKAYGEFSRLTDLLLEHIGQMRAGTARLKRPQLAQQTETALQAMGLVKVSGKKVSESRLMLLESQARTTAALAQLKTLAAARAESSMQQVKTIGERQQEVVQAVDARVRTALIFIAAAAGLIIAASVILNARTIATVRRRLGQAVEVADAVSRGELQAVPVPAENDETTQLIASLRSMVDILTGSVGHIRSAAQSIESGTAEITKGNLDLSARTELQASGLQATASAVLDLSDSVKKNADTARSATELAAAASDSAAAGGELVAEVVTTMDRIHEASRQVSEIVGVIENIAFRTNLLALNAAVEAAQAGVHGHGFAVVANEVRDLASKSGVAAKEIKALISDTVARIEVGHKRAEIAGSAMLEIVSQAHEVSGHVASISDATGRQAAAIEQVRYAVQRLEALTQQNAALAEQTSAATGVLRSQATELTAAVSVFRLAEARPPLATQG